MGMLMRSAALSIAMGVLLVFLLFHLIFALPFWLLVGGVALGLWLRADYRRGRSLGWGRAPRRLRSRW